MVLRQIRAFSLALILFVGSLVTSRIATSKPTPISPIGAPSPTATPPSLAPTIVPTPTHTWTPTPLPPTPTVQVEGTVVLDEQNTTTYPLPTGSIIHPLRMVIRGSDPYVLDTGELKLVSLSARPSWRSILPPDDTVEGVVVQELADIALSGDKNSLLLLDRAGNLFRYLPDDGSWQVERSAHMAAANSRQHLISVGARNDEVFLLDTNVGQIWWHQEGQAEVISVEIDLRESVDFAVGEDIYVLAQEGYHGPLRLQKVGRLPSRTETGFSPPSDLTDPSLLFLDQEAGGHLYVIDKGHQRLRVLDRESGAPVRDYLFADDGMEIGSIYKDQGRLYLATRDAIYVYPSEPSDPARAEPTPRPAVALSSLPPHDSSILILLPPLALPISGTMLSDMAFRLPGAPRSYRYGVHEGIDFYSVAGQAVTSDTPVLSVAKGEVIRVDREYQAPSAEEMEDTLSHAQAVYHTPEDTLDVLRGRQVWIDHGDALVSRYCHLSAVADDLEVGQWVEQGQILGRVGNSGTPASYSGQGLEMHLHLEIRIGDGYLGQYLRPIEVKRWLAQAFGGRA